MSLKSCLLGICALAIGLSICLIGSCQTDGASGIERKRVGDYQIELFRNSDTMSQILAINSSGAVLGFKEAPPDLKHVYFYQDASGFKDMPTPKGFTHVEALALSDAGLVVGRAMKAIGSQGSLRAVVWSPKKSDISLLPVPEGDAVADAHDISADGKWITGYATGSGRLRPVVWQWNDSQSQWQVETLPTVHENNPYLMSSQLHITPDAKTIVGCCTEAFLPDGTIDSSLYAWEKVDGKWTRRRVSEEQLYVKAINNERKVVGSSIGEQGRLPCLVMPDGKFKLLDLPAGKVHGEAHDINDQSVIVGWSDSAVGSEGGPAPCNWNIEGKVTVLAISDLEVGMLYTINDRGQLGGAADVITKPEGADKPGDAVSALLGVRISNAK